MTGAAPERRSAWCAWISGDVEEHDVVLVRATTEEEALREARVALRAADADVVDVARCPDGWETWLPEEYELEEGGDSDFSIVVTGVPGFTERSRVTLAEVRFASSFPELHFLARRIARLVAAAPAMFRALEAYEDFPCECDRHPGTACVGCTGRGALALARGGAS